MSGMTASEWTSDTVREEIMRLTKRAVELEDRCEQLRLMNDRLREALGIYLDADNRARRMLDGLR